MNYNEYIADDPSIHTIIGKKQCKTAEDLRTKYPAIFSEPCEITILDGWVPLVDTLCYLLQRTYDLNQHLGYTQVIAEQVKQKLGGLRFYCRTPTQIYPNENSKWTHWEEWVCGAVAMTESMANRTCEYCGSPGKREHFHGYLYTACDLHKKKD